ncbi:hypothetical protein [Herbidospora daliensis]|uniref:hypothetical protein n=1 Tax=Herbidospora daliensis TaxID=295585 RepID=UPI0007857D4E|nr:hypothetical protein [Herbidospora daliensis]
MSKYEINITGDENRVSVRTAPHQPWLWIVLALLLIMGATTIYLLLPDEERQETAPLGSGTYTVILEGSVANGSPFTRQGELRVRQPADWCLRVGNPAGAPAPGAIWFASNASCFEGSADDVYAERTTDGEQTVLTPVNHARSMNLFNAVSGVTAAAYTPDRGEVRFQADGATVTGTVNLQGIDTTGGTAERGVFTATFEAAQISDDPEALISSPEDPVEATPGVAEDHDATGARYSVKTVVSLEQIEGDPDNLDRARARIAGAIFVVDARDGGDFVYAPADSRDDLFPVEGTVGGAEPVFVVSGERAADQAKVTVGGSLDRSGAEPVIELTVTTTAFSDTTSYEFRAVLQPVSS